MKTITLKLNKEQEYWNKGELQYLCDGRLRSLFEIPEEVTRITVRVSERSFKGAYPFKMDGDNRYLHLKYCDGLYYHIATVLVFKDFITETCGLQAGYAGIQYEAL